MSQSTPTPDTTARTETAETAPAAWIREGDMKKLAKSQKPLQLWVFSRDPSDISGTPYVALAPALSPHHPVGVREALDYEAEAEFAWNLQADEHNRWFDLSDEEQESLKKVVAFAIGRGRSLDTISNPPAQDAPVAVKVKALEWDPPNNPLESSVAVSAIGKYLIMNFGDYALWEFSGDADQPPQRAVGLEAAKSADQSDYERRILSSLVSSENQENASRVGAGDNLAVGQRVVVRGSDQDRYSGFSGVVLGQVDGSNYRVRLDLEVYPDRSGGTVFGAGVLEAALDPSPPLPEADGEVVAYCCAYIDRVDEPSEIIVWGKQTADFYKDRGWSVEPLVRQSALVSALHSLEATNGKLEWLHSDAAALKLRAETAEAAREKAEQVAAGLREALDEAIGHLESVAKDVDACSYLDDDWGEGRPTVLSRLRAALRSTEEGKTATPSVKEEEVG